MSSDFAFNSPPRLVVGWGAATDGRLVGEIGRLGKRPFWVTGKSGRGVVLGDAAGIWEGVPAEPSVDVLQAVTDAVRMSGADCVVAVGGGSVLDVAKGAAALARAAGSASEYFAGKRSVPEAGGLPIVAVPTTSGTGSEVTWVGVFTEKGGEGPPRKASMRGGAMMPAVAVLDAQLTVTCPASVTAHSGLDAFVQAVEAYTSAGANALTDALAFPAAKLASYENVARAVQEPANREAREALAMGSMMAGMALNTSRLGLVHGLAHPIGALTGAAHGLLCGMLLPPVMHFNREAASEKYARLAELLLGDGASVDALLETVDDYVYSRLELPRRLSEIGLQSADLERVAAEAMTSGSTKANPRPVTQEEAKAVTEACL